MVVATIGQSWVRVKIGIKEIHIVHAYHVIDAHVIHHGGVSLCLSLSAEIGSDGHPASVRHASSPTTLDTAVLITAGCGRVDVAPHLGHPLIRRRIVHCKIVYGLMVQNLPFIHEPSREDREPN